MRRASKNSTGGSLISVSTEPFPETTSFAFLKAYNGSFPPDQIKIPINSTIPNRERKKKKPIIESVKEIITWKATASEAIAAAAGCMFRLFLLEVGNKGRNPLNL